jgi:hypothetical protein
VSAASQIRPAQGCPEEMLLGVKAFRKLMCRSDSIQAISQSNKIIGNYNIL